MVSNPPQPTHSQAARRLRVPAQPTSFIGREKELAEIAERLADPACRLLTLIGVGGIGKTRLSLQTATQCQTNFADGVYFVPLQPVQSVEFLPATLADALQFALAGQKPPFNQVCDYLRDRELLLVLDNFEHLLPEDGSDLLGKLLAAAPHIKLLITSREALHLREEWLYPVEGLPFPSPELPTPPAEFAAVELFVERARQVRHDFSAAEDPAALARICQLVNGMPLALELAAAWAKSLTCAEIAVEIQGGLDFLSTSLRNIPERHRSIQAIFDHTWQQLGQKEQAVFARLSVFRGGFDRDAAGAVAGTSLPLLSSLLDKALLRWEPAAIAAGVSGRYQIHELLRQYGAEQLARSPAEKTAAYDAHCAYYCQFLYARRDDVLGGRQREAFVEIRAELENIRAAWQWASRHTRVADIQRANYTFFQFCNSQSRYVEGLDILEKVAHALYEPNLEQQQRVTLAALLNQLGWLSIRLGRPEQAKTVLERSRDIFNEQQVAPQPGLGTDPLTTLATLANVRGDYAEAVRLGEEARRNNEVRGDKFNLTLALYALTNAAYAQGGYEAAHDYAQQAYDLTQETGNHWFMAYVLNDMGAVARALGNYAQAQQHFQASYDIRATFEDPEGMALALGQLGKLAILQENYAGAEQLFQQSLPLYQEINDRGGQAVALNGLGQAALAQSDTRTARQQFQQALQIAAEIQFVPLMLSLLKDIGHLLLQTGQTTQGLELLALADHHPASDDETRAKVQRLLAHYEVHVSPEIVTTAKERGQTLELTEVTTALITVLSELEIPTKSPRSSAPMLPRPPAPLPPRSPAPPQADVPPLIDPLSERELEVLGHIAAGLQNREIAVELTVTLSTVKTHINNIYRKLDVTNRVQALSRARELGLL